LRFYDLFFWCVHGQHFVAKEAAVFDERGAPTCPTHKRKLRTKPTHTAERDRLYPRSRVA